MTLDYETTMRLTLRGKSARIAFLADRVTDLQAAGNRLLFRARDAEDRLREALAAVAAVRGDLDRVGESVRCTVAAQAAEIARLNAVIDEADRLGFSPGTLRAIAASCSTPADRVGKTQDEVFRAKAPSV